MSGIRAPEDLAAFFGPRSIAVVGASRDPTKVGGSVVANLRAAGFEGRVWPVNPKADVVHGLPAAASLLAIDGPVDLAVIAVPAPAVLPALKECVAKGIRGAVVISAGFREAGDAGRAREAELRAWLRGQPIRVLGPNCLGWIRPSRRLNATFAPGMPPAGGIPFLSHSGALATAILDWASTRRFGFSFFATLGNQADLTESDVLEAAANDPETRVIVAYLEGLADGRRFFEALRATTPHKPVVLLKAGRGEPPVDRTALAETISRVGQLAVDCPDLVELDLNPLVATSTGVIAVDARATLDGLAVAGTSTGPTPGSISPRQDNRQSFDETT